MSAHDDGRDISTGVRGAYRRIKVAVALALTVPKVLVYLFAFWLADLSRT